MEKNKSGKTRFDFIAPFYGLFYNHQKKLYRRILDQMQNYLDLTAYANVIDLGCGTGALCSVLNQRGLAVTGIDPARMMLAIAAGKSENQAIDFRLASATQRLPFADKSFDICIASYVAHGLPAPERKAMYAEMNRITRHWVIIHDYNQNRARLSDLVEWLEGGDYFNFIISVQQELQDNFKNMRVVDVDVQVAWYICEPN